MHCIQVMSLRNKLYSKTSSNVIVIDCPYLSVCYIYRVFLGRPEGQRRLGRFMRRWENKVKMADTIIRNMGGCGLIKMAQDSVL
jgi:hypothetical protein